MRRIGGEIHFRHPYASRRLVSRDELYMLPRMKLIPHSMTPKDVRSMYESARYRFAKYMRCADVYVAPCVSHDTLLVAQDTLHQLPSSWDEFWYPAGDHDEPAEVKTGYETLVNDHCQQRPGATRRPVEVP